MKCRWYCGKLYVENISDSWYDSQTDKMHLGIIVINSLKGRAVNWLHFAIQV